MAKAITLSEFIALARRQIHDAEAILQTHRTDGIGLCSCGRPQPCTVASTCHGRITYYRAKLASLDITQPLPVIKPAVQAAPAHRPQPQPRGW